jgi:hypothetical protein
MITKSKRWLAALFACLGFSLPAAAATFSATDYTDLWGTTTPNESGWGLNLIQQNDVIFATMFVYGPDGSARWYSASDLSSSNGTTWSATLWETRGPWFGLGSFDANAVSRAAVGTMTLNFSGPNNGVLNYTISGTNVAKNITRFSLRLNNLTGNYLGGLTALCANTQAVWIFGTLKVTHNSSLIAMRVNFYNASSVASECNFNGTYNAQGRLATISGSFSCTFGSAAGNAGSFTITNVEASQNGFNGAFSGTDQYCSMNGQFGGVKDVR